MFEVRIVTLNLRRYLKVVLRPISPDFGLCSLALPKHVVSDVTKKVITLASLALSTLAPMFSAVAFNPCAVSMWTSDLVFFGYSQSISPLINSICLKSVECLFYRIFSVFWEFFAIPKQSGGLPPVFFPPFNYAKMRSRMMTTLFSKNTVSSDIF